MEPGEVAILKVLDTQQQDQVLRLAKRVTVPSGAVLFREGESATTVYLLLSGQVGVFKRGPGGAEVEISRPGPGEIVGEMAALVRRPRSASVKAISECEMLALNWPDVEQLMLTDGRLATPLLTALCATLAGRLIVMNERLAQLQVGVLKGLD